MVMGFSKGMRRGKKEAGAPTWAAGKPRLCGHLSSGQSCPARCMLRESPGVHQYPWNSGDW